MAFEDYLNDLCDIYHAQKGDESPGYGLTEQPSFSYPKEPDELSVACHFAVKSESTSVSQTAPANIKESGPAHRHRRETQRQDRGQEERL